MRPKIRFAEIIARYLGQPFEKIGCMPLVAKIYTDMGVDFPNSYGELTLENYLAAFEVDPSGTVAQMEELFSGLGEPVDPDHLKVKDLLVVEHPGGVRFPAVYTGNLAAIASFLNGGVTVFGLNSQNRVVTARRLT